MKRRMYPEIDPEHTRHTVEYEEFHHDDAGYQRWLDSHGTGFVLNVYQWLDQYAGVVHRSTCHDMSPKTYPGREMTSNRKICLNDQLNAVRWTWTRDETRN